MQSSAPGNQKRVLSRLNAIQTTTAQTIFKNDDTGIGYTVNGFPCKRPIMEPPSISILNGVGLMFLGRLILPNNIQSVIRLDFEEAVILGQTLRLRYRPNLDVIP